MANSRPKPILIVILILQILICLAIYFLCACLRRRRQRHQHATTSLGLGLNGPKPDDTLPRGLDPILLESFPIIPCSALKDVKPGCGPDLARLECAVCLSSFREDQTLRFIPNCQHVFHPVCVDRWFRHHSTCPYCRANLTRSGSGGPDSVVIIVVTGASDDEKYTLRLSDEVWREIMSEDTCRSDDCPEVLGCHGGDEYDHQETPTVSESD